MYQVTQVQAEAEAFRAAVAQAEPFRPLMVKIKLLWQCNLDCRMCDYWRHGSTPPLDFELVTRALDELASLGCRKVHFSGGEPTLRADLPDIVAHARRLKLRVTLTTNGTLLDKELSKQLVKAGLNSVCVSIDSPVRSVHDQMRGVRGAFKQTVAGVRELRRAAKEREVSLPIRINTVVCRHNYDTLAGLPELIHSLNGKSILLLPVCDPSGELLLNKRRLLDYNQRIAPALAERALAWGLMRTAREAFPFGVTHQELAASRDGHYARGLFAGQPCYAPWTHALIAADGHVAPCCSAPRVVLGNLAQQSFAEIWHGSPYRRLRQSMRDGSPLRHCADCNVFLAENRILHQIVSANLR
ncbi:MAG: radical SAM protein [Thermoflexales bacterium]|nr:radical SAM protein [Thermoflexales bacterium]